MANLLSMSGGSLLKPAERYLTFKDIDIWTVCCCNWGDYDEVVITDNGDDTVDIATTPVHMENTTSTRGTTVIQENVDNTGGTYTAGTTKVPIGIKKSQCLAVTGIKDGILKLVDCKLFAMTRSYDKSAEIYGYKILRSDAQKADCRVVFDIDANNVMKYYCYYQRFGYINGASDYINYPQFGYEIDSDALLCLFGQSSFTLVNGIGYFNSIEGYRPSQYGNQKYYAVSQDAESLPIPYDAQVEYLQSSGTQYIELPYKPNQDTSIEISVAVAVGNGTAISQIFETRNGAWSKEYALINFGDSNNLLQARFGDKSGGTRISNRLDEGTVYKIEYRKNKVYVDDVHVATLTNYTFQCDYYLTLFGLNNVGGITAAAGSPQIYYMKIYDGDTLAMDLIPVRKGQKGYMYDRISHRMWGNVGTDNFILGSDIVEIEYLETTGTQYISCEDCDPIDKVEIEFRYTGSVSQARIFNAGTTSSATGLSVYINGNGYMATSINSDWTTNSKLWPLRHHILTLDATTKTTTIDTAGEITTWSTTKTPNYLRGFMLLSNNCSARLYGCKLYSGGSLVFDFIPVRVGQVGYLYDKISGMLYGNSGTGDFTLGQDLSTPLVEIEYLESTGTQYVDVGLYPSNTTGSEVIVVASYQGNDTVQNVYGCCSNNASPYFQINKTTTANRFRWLLTQEKNYTFSDYANFHEYKVDEGTLYIDDEAVVTGQGTSTVNMSLFLFARHKTNMTVDQPGSWRIKSFYIDVPTGTWDLIPVRRGTVGYFKDKNTGRLFENIGTGDLILGPDKT